jgi:hypothetical protein
VENDYFPLPSKFEMKNKLIILGTIKDESLYFLHSCFGLPDGNNDVNVLNKNLLVKGLWRGASIDIGFDMNGNHYHRYNLLVDEIYP